MLSGSHPGARQELAAGSWLAGCGVVWLALRPSSRSPRNAFIVKKERKKRTDRKTDRQGWEFRLLGSPYYLRTCILLNVRTYVRTLATTCTRRGRGVKNWGAFVSYAPCIRTGRRTTVTMPDIFSASALLSVSQAWKRLKKEKGYYIHVFLLSFSITDCCWLAR